MSHAANTSIQDIQNGIGDFVLRPEADRNSLDGIQRIRVIEDKHHQREENN